MSARTDLRPGEDRQVLLELVEEPRRPLVQGGVRHQVDLARNVAVVAALREEEMNGHVVVADAPVKRDRPADAVQHVVAMGLHDDLDAAAREQREEAAEA